MACEVLSHDEKNKKTVAELLKQVSQSANDSQMSRSFMDAINNQDRNSPVPILDSASGLLQQNIATHRLLLTTAN